MVTKKIAKIKENPDNTARTGSVLAVVELSGHQYLVKEGEVFTIDRRGLETGESFEIKQVLLLSKDGQAKFGRPYLEGAGVKLEIVENLKGPKIDVYKYKAKSRYRKHIGYRSSLTKVRVISISS
ncbi:MAG: 50S ribosomal protein L21 [Patescibacteria group bacterium]|nr:50S ribosomal protein L21 [Patescibacteria group bacterium]